MRIRKLTLMLRNVIGDEGTGASVEVGVLFFVMMVLISDRCCW